MRSTASAVLVATAAMSALVNAGCGQTVVDPELRVAGTPTPVIVSASNVSAGQPVSFGSVILCLPQHGSVTIEGVSLAGAPAGLHLDAFAVRPNPFVIQKPGVGAERSQLRTLGFNPGAAQVVDSQCPSPGAEQTWKGGSELAFQVSYAATGAVVAQSLEVKYSFGTSETRTLSIPYGVQLCPGVCAIPSSHG